MDSGPQKRSLTISGHRTSVSLEKAFWDALAEVAALQARSIADVVSEVDQARGSHGLSSALRVYVLNYYREALDGQTR